MGIGMVIRMNWEWKVKEYQLSFPTYNTKRQQQEGISSEILEKVMTLEINQSYPNTNPLESPNKSR